MNARHRQITIPATVKILKALESINNALNGLTQMKILEWILTQMNKHKERVVIKLNRLLGKNVPHILTPRIKFVPKAQAHKVLTP